MTSDLFAVVWCAAAWAAVAGILAAIAVHDLRSRRIPNALVIALVAVWAALQAGLLAAGADPAQLAEAARRCGVPAWLAVRLVPAGALEGLLTAVAAAAILWAVAAVFERASGKEAMGAGDVKLIAALALFAGPVRLAVLLLAACLLALVGSLLARKRAFPFAPALAAGFVIALSANL